MSKEQTQEYLGNGKHLWEEVIPGQPEHRLRVPCGWIYRSNFDAHASRVFVPMPVVVKHKV